MAERLPSVFAGDLTSKWRALAERRKAHLVDLYDSGRWRLYFSEQELVVRLREANQVLEQWSNTEQSAARRTATVPAATAEGDSGTGSGDRDETMAFASGANSGLGCGDRGEDIASAAKANDNVGRALSGAAMFCTCTEEAAASEREPA